MEKVSRKTLKKQEKNKGQQQLRERRVLNKALGTTVSGNIACVLWSGGLWWEEHDKKEGERRQRALEMELLGNGEREVKGYCAAQLAASNVNLAHEMFQSGSSLFPRGRRGGRCHPVLVVLWKAMFSPVPVSVKTGDADGQRSQMEPGLPGSCCLLLLPMEQPCSLCGASACSPPALLHALYYAPAKQKIHWGSE